MPEDRVAWHAGRSHWRGREALNATSIGIEIVNLHGDRHDYPAAQIAALIELCHGILARHPAIVPRNVVGHSDIAPKRKIDPGLRFPWATLAHAGIGLWPRPGPGHSRATCRRPCSASAIAPAVDCDRRIVAAFQRRFRPAGPTASPIPRPAPCWPICSTRSDRRPSEPAHGGSTMRVDVHAHLWSERYLDLLVRLGNGRTAVHRGLGAGDG